MANHLLHEKSPYLLQHRQNPVDWYPWCGEAFEKAQAEDKPVFLSIGYSTCHWCHVMARESFEDEEIAEILNARFVPVKVDREERPEIDMVYMEVCQAMTGQGGWPLTILMTPDKKPFFAGTYLPRRSRRNLTGLWELLNAIDGLWRKDRDRLLHISGEILRVLDEGRGNPGPPAPFQKLITEGFRELEAAFDKEHGGFGAAPKFPAPHNLLFLMALYRARQEESALAMAEKTLESMARGGIHDQIGGGFSRYSTDRSWLAPHFEKMLYDNALLTLAYLKACHITGRPYYRRTAEGILTYVARELEGLEGGFYSGQDADSQGVEGKYYVFTVEEIEAALGDKKDAEDFCRWFGITKAGNFEGRNIPNLIHNPDFDRPDPHMEELCARLYQYRQKRTPLHRDDKALSSWNSMMIMAWAEAGFVLGNRAYTEKARKAQTFIETYLVDSRDRLLVRYCRGESAFPGNLDDYAYYSLALLTLYRTTLDIAFLEAALSRASQMVELFWDREKGGFYFYGEDAPRLIRRPKEAYDGAVPSGNSAAAHALLSLAGLTGEERWRSLGDRQLEFLAAEAGGYPSGHSFSLTAFLRDLGEERRLVCVSGENQVPEELWDYMKEPQNEGVFVLFKCPGNQDRLSQAVPSAGEYKIPGEGVCYYLCKNQTCGLPFTSLSRITEDQREAHQP